MKEENEEFDFSLVGKKMPYTIPQGSMQQMHDSILEKVNAEKHSAHRVLMLWLPYAVAASLIILTGWGLIEFNQHDSDSNEANSSLLYSDESWKDFAEADIFLEDM